MAEIRHIKKSPRVIELTESLRDQAKRCGVALQDVRAIDIFIIAKKLQCEPELVRKHWRVLLKG